MNIHRLPSNNKPVNPFNNAPLPYFGKTSDYVPLFTIYKPSIEEINFDLLPESSVKERLKVIKGDGDIPPITKIYLSKACNALLDSYEYYRDFISEFKKAASSVITDEDVEFSVKHNNSCCSNYGTLITNITTRNTWESAKLRNFNYISNFWYCAQYTHSPKTNNVKIKTIFTVMAKREMIPYLRMCFLMGEEPHPDALELWVREDFDIVKSEYAGMRTNYRKYVKKEILDSGIKIFEFPCLDKLLFYSAKIPKFKRIADRKEWVNQIGLEFLEGLNVENHLKSSRSIELVFD